MTSPGRNEWISSRFATTWSACWKSVYGLRICVGTATVCETASLGVVKNGCHNIEQLVTQARAIMNAVKDITWCAWDLVSTWHQFPIVETVLSEEDKVKEAMSSYIDIFVNDNVALVMYFKEHLSWFGLNSAWRKGWRQHSVRKMRECNSCIFLILFHDRMCFLSVESLLDISLFVVGSKWSLDSSNGEWTHFSATVMKSCLMLLWRWLYKKQLPEWNRMTMWNGLVSQYELPCHWVTAVRKWSSDWGYIWLGSVQ